MRMKSELMGELRVNNGKTKYETTTIDETKGQQHHDRELREKVNKTTSRG